jgi:hypothetical protein
MAMKVQGGRMVPAGQDTAGKDIKRKALNSAIQKMQQMKSIAESLRRDFDASTPVGGPLWRQPGYEEIPATVYTHIPDLLDHEIRRAQTLLAQVR